MALNKQAVAINFSQGLDTKTDPFQVQLGKFLRLKNMVFTKGGLLTKRNGYAQTSSLPNKGFSYLTTFNQDLTAIGSELAAYSSPTQTWVTQANMQPLQLDVLSLIKNNTNQSQVDAAVAPNGLVCTVYTDQTPTSLSTPVYKYVIADSVTGQNLIEPTAIVHMNVATGGARVFVVGNYFIILFVWNNSGTKHLQFIAITISNPTIVTAPADISLSITTSAHGVSYDAAVYDNTLYVAWNGASTSGLKMAYVTSHLSVSSVINPDASHIADIVSVSTDQSDGTIWVAYYGYSANTGYAVAQSPQLHSILGATQIIPSPAGTHVANLACSSQSGKMTFFYEITNNYGYDSIPSNYIKANTILEAGTLGTAYVMARSVGLASKSFIMNGVIYMLTAYASSYQSTYFLCDLDGNVISKLAYQNGGGYYALVTLPSVTVSGSVASIAYLFKDLIQAVNKNTNVPSGSQVNGIYSQTGLNLVTFTFGTARLAAAEIGQNLNITGGITWAYDGYSLTEQEFLLYPDSVEAASSATSGSMTGQQYFYQVCYEWSDNQGNLFRSSPSIPVTVTLSGDNSVDLNIPTLRLSYKNINNPVKIVIYRWSVAQQTYYQTTSITTPLINDPTVDSVAYNDGNDDATILGNNILYTTGGVLENIGPPAFDSVFLFDNRLWGIDSEDKNLLWYSKQVIENTPVEMSDLLTLYVSPTIGAQGSTGVLKCGAAMDDKLILFKASAMNYVNGEGPDNTGANNQYSQPIFLTATVGCSNQSSIVFQPQGLMFEFASEAGNQIWLLGRNLTTEYIGAPVEALTLNATVTSAVNIPGTNQVRFTLSSGITLMYDYYYGQWGTFQNVPAVSSVLYQGLHTYINSLGLAFQESPGTYLDGASPVLLGFTTSWLQLAGLQGYQRAYFFYLLGTYYSPHLLNMSIAYDYNPAVVQQTLISPDNFSPNYGNGLNYGVSSPYGGPTNLEKWKVYLTQQRCDSFQISLDEIYDPRFGLPAGAGLSLSGMNCVVGVKKGYRPTQFTHQAGSS